MKIDTKAVNKYNKKFLMVLSNNDSFIKEIEGSQSRVLPTVKQRKGKIISWNETLLEKETERIMQCFSNLPDSWRESVKQLIKTNELTPPKSTTAPIVILESADEWGRGKLGVQVFKHTTKKEYVEAWDEIKARQKMMFEFKPKPLSKVELKIIGLRKDGKNEIEIYNELDGFDEIELDSIRKIISRKAPQLGVTVKHKKS